jgi:hypothetical protein
MRENGIATSRLHPNSKASHRSKALSASPPRCLQFAVAGVRAPDHIGTYGRSDCEDSRDKEMQCV